MLGLEDERAKATAKNKRLLALSCEEVLHEMANFISSSTGKKVILRTLHEDYHHLVEPLQSLFPHSANVKG